MELLAQTKEPLKPGDGSMLSPWKQNTSIRKELYRISEFVPLLLTIEKALGDHDCAFEYRCFWWSQFVELVAKDESDARKIAGYLIRAFKKKPTIEKIADDQLLAKWIIDKIPVTLKGYKPATCHYEEIEVKVPAQKARVEKKKIPAIKAHIEKRRVLVCDEVKSEEQFNHEVIEQVSAEIKEVPF